MPSLITKRRTMAFFTISHKYLIYNRHHIPLVTQYYFEKFRNFEHNHMMKSIEEILESVPKSYSKHAHLLMKHLFQKAVLDRIS